MQDAEPTVTADSADPAGGRQAGNIEAEEPAAPPDGAPEAATTAPPPPEDEEEVIIPPESPPALRRSSRRPGLTQRPTRDSPSRSPTPSTSSDDDDEDPADAAERRRFKPILADQDGVKQMLADRANQDWLDALKHRVALASGLQHLANSGGREGVVMVGAFGAHTKESDAVEDFLYAVKVGGESGAWMAEEGGRADPTEGASADHQLKIANQLPTTEL